MKSLKINSLHIDLWESGIQDQDKTIIILIGVPGKPKEYEIISKFNAKGFNVLIPHYEGTWQSEGKFLEQAPAVYIDELIKKIDSENVYILGSSFGGWVGWGLEDVSKLKKVCITSPVVSFKKVSGIETLSDYLRKTFPHDYRFNDEAWKKLLDDNFQDFNLHIKLNPEKVMILAGKNDNQINPLDVQVFAKTNNITNIHIEDCGHITPSKVSEEQFNKIIDFFLGK